ncbi:MAG: FtsX-like permease family protein, partial [Saprospiraceae bacterium]|nr:FtsX-like permease family protein [Saprospiraceae bacterium]
SFPTLSGQLFTDINQNWNIHFYYTYLLLDQGTDPAALDDKLEAFIDTYYEEETAARYNPELVQLGDIYFHTEADTAIGARSDFRKVTILSVIALFILGIAVFNYVNLSTAQSVDKAKETGVRKVVGASRFSLVKQYLSESIAFCLVASLLAAGASYFLLPLFNKLAAKQIALSAADLLSLTPLWIGLALVVGMLAGLYPAFVLSSFRPSVVFQRLSASGDQTRTLRSLLVSLQFCISVFLIIATLVVYRQLLFLQQKDLGFEEEGIVEIALVSRDMTDDYALLKRQMNSLGPVLSASGCSRIAGKELYYLGYRFEDLEEGPRVVHMARYHVDHDFFNTMDIQILAGGPLTPSFDSDSSGMLVLNEAAIRELGIENPESAIGQRVTYQRPGSIRVDGTIWAVCENFHALSLHNQIVPMVMDYWRESFNYLNVRLSSVNYANIEKLEATYQSLFPGNPFEFSFLDERIDQLYDQEQRLGQLFFGFTLIAIVISVLGLIGVSAYTIERRTKEIGIRKVLGAGRWQIAGMLSKGMLKLVALSFILASPPAYWAMQQWLDNFPYKIDISPGIILFAALLVLLTAMLSVGSQALRAAMMNPVNSIKDE